MDAIATARALATAHPATKLPCPVCAASLNAENLERHLAKVHVGANATATTWRGKGMLGLTPCTLALDGDSVVLGHWLGLARRTVTLPCAIEVGGMFSNRPDVMMSTYDEVNSESVVVRTGRYLRLVGDRAITIGCRQQTQFTTHWNRAGWQDGGKRRSCDIRVPVEAMLAIEYALAGHGLLEPIAAKR